MQYRTLGRTGISVSQLALGGMMFGSFGNADHEDSIRVIHTALDAGINFIDTADGYSHGESEEIIGEALHGRRDDVMVAVKFGVSFGGDQNLRGGSRRWIVRAVEGSLRRLRTDYIDLYQLGAPDPNTDLDETLSALTDLVAAGKIRSFGSSKMPASQVVEAQWVADHRGYGRFRSEQPPYSMLARGIEYDLLPTTLRQGMGVLSYSPLAGGWLSGKYRQGQDDAGPGSAARSANAAYDTSNPANARKFEAADALGALADEAGLTLVQRDRLRGPAPGRDLRDHRPAHHGAPRGLPRRRWGRALHRRARPHRPDRRARRHDQRGRQLLAVRHHLPHCGIAAPLTARAQARPARYHLRCNTNERKIVP